MLFTQLNGLASQPAESRAEIDVLQDLACRIGPRVDGINASRSLPQSMGAFVTSGAQGACVGREQQSEQHMPTTMHGLGADMAIAPSATTSPTTPTTSTSTFSKLLALRTATMLAPQIKVAALDVRTAPAPSPDSTAPGTTPGMAPSAATYPPPFYKKWQFWAAVAGGVVVVGGGSYFLLRKRRTA